MSVSILFSNAFQLWKRHVLWLILAALVIGLIVAAIGAVIWVVVIGAALGGSLSLAADSSALTGIGGGMIGVAVIVAVIGWFAIVVLSTTLYGGLFHMVIGASREDRPVQFGDLFAGFRRFRTYGMFALVVGGIALGLSVLLIIPVIGWIGAPVLGLWIGVLWLYVLPLIADQDLSWGDARLRGQQMVKQTGWWRTFGMLILLGIAIWAVGLVIFLIAWAIGKASSDAGATVGGLLSFVFQMGVGPYVICYVSTMYLEAADVERPVLTPGYAAAAPPAPPAPSQGYAPPAAPPASPAAPVTSAPPATPAVPVTPPAAAPTGGPAAPVTPPATPPTDAPVTPPVTPGTQPVADSGPQTPETPPPAPPAPPAGSPPPPPPLT